MSAKVRTIRFRKNNIYLVRIDHVLERLADKLSHIENSNNLLKQTLNKNVIYQYYNIIDHMPGTKFVKI